MTYTPALLLENTSLFSDGNLALFLVALVFRLLAIPISIRLLIENTPLFGRFSPIQLQKPYKQLSRQQQYRYICSICLVHHMVFHLVHITLDMLIISPGTPLSYQTSQVNTAVIISNIFALIYIAACCNAIVYLILTEIDRYNRITLVVPGSLRATLVYGAGRIVMWGNILSATIFWITYIVRIRDEATQSNTFSKAIMNLVSTIRDGYAFTLSGFVMLLGFYLNMSTVQCALYKIKAKPLLVTAQTASVRTRILGFLILIFMAVCIAFILMAVGVFNGPYYPFALLSWSAGSTAVSFSFSLTDLLLHSLKESKQELKMEENQVDLTGYKTGTDIIQEGLLISGPARTQYLGGSERL